MRASTRRLVALLASTVLIAVSAVAPASAQSTPQRTLEPVRLAVDGDEERDGTTLEEKAALQGATLQAQAEFSDLQVIPYDNAVVTATRLAERIMGGRGSISNATFTGANGAAGIFLGGANTFLVRDGIVLSSGHVNGVLGPNLSDSITTNNGRGGDPDLDGLVPGGGTLDASVLEFDMVPNTSVLRFDFVFASDEYNEYANTQFNDVFGFYIDGQNVALLPDGQTNITINSINGGNPLGTGAVNPQFYINNDLDDGGVLDTEMDGLTTVIGVTKDVDPGQSYHVKLAIADVGDRNYDANVLIGTPNDCGSFNTDAAQVDPNPDDPPDAPNVTVKYDPRELVPENQPDFADKARRIAEEIRKRADKAIARYRSLGLVANPDVEIRLVCDIGVGDPLNIDFEFEFGPINIDIIPESADGFVEAENKIKLRASTIRNEFKPIVDAGFPDVGPGSDWDTSTRFWAGLVDHEVFHTIQVKKVGGGLSSLDQLRRGSRLIVESGAMLGQDLQLDADDQGRSDLNSSEYLDRIGGWFNNTPSIKTGPVYDAAAVFQYWGERFGTPAGSMEEQVAEWYMRLIQPLHLIPEIDPDTGVAVMKEVLGDVDLYDALRDFYVSAYVRRAANIVGNPAFDGRYRILDEEDAFAVAPYPHLTPVERDLAAGPIQPLAKTRDDPLRSGEAEFYEVNLPANATAVRISYDSETTGGVGPFNWFGGTSPTRLAFVPFAADPDPRTDPAAVATVGWFIAGARPDDGTQVLRVDTAGRSKLGVIVVASDDDAAYTMTIEPVVGTADLTLDRPNDQFRAFVQAGAASQPIFVRVRPTLNGEPEGGLGKSSFTVRVGATDATVTSVARLGNTYVLRVDPDAPLAAGTYPISVTYGGVTKTNQDAVEVVSLLSAASVGADVRVDAFFPDGGAAGTPMRVVAMVTEPFRGIADAQVTAIVTAPDGRIRTFPLVDDGGTDDTLAADGVFAANLWATDVAGRYDISVEVAGTDSTGTAFSQVVAGAVTLTAKVDGDGDGIADAVESRFGLDPAVPEVVDHDHDGLPLAAELADGTNPWTWDTDDGGENDASEVAAGRNPLDAGDDGDVSSMTLRARSLDGQRIEVSLSTADETADVRLYRFTADDVDDQTLLGTFDGGSTTLVDGPLAAGTFGYAAIAVGAGGAQSAPVIAGPFVARGDATFPEARLVVEGGRWETNDRDVTVAFFDLSEPVTQMRIAESADGLLNAAWVPFVESSTFTIGASVGDHPIYAQVRDASALQSPVMTASVTHDPIAPTSALGSLPALVAQSSVDIAFTASDAETFVANVELWVRYRAASADPWGAWALEASSATSPITYSFAHGEGMYEFHSVAADGAGNRESPPASADSSTLHSTGDAVPPSAPTDLTATAVAWNRVDLAWTASADNVEVTSYTIHRDGTAIAIVGGSVTSFRDLAVQPATAYSYTVTASDEAGNASAASGPAAVTTPAYVPPADTTPPTAPTNVFASLGSTNSSGFTPVSVNWLKSSDNVAVTSYTVLRNGVAIGVEDATGSTGETFTDWSTAPSTTYTYTVKANDASGNASAASAGATVTTPSCANCSSTIRPIADIQNSGFTPKSGTSLYVQLRETISDGELTYITGPLAKTGSATVRLGGSYYATPIDYVRVQYSARRFLSSGTTGTVKVQAELYRGALLIGKGFVRTLSSGYITYTDTFTSVPTSYLSDLRVKLVQVSATAKSASRFSWVAATVFHLPSDSTAPSVPGGLSASAASDRQVNLVWTASTDANGVQGYRVYRDGVQIGTLPVNSTTFKDVGRTPTTSYEYEVAAVDGAGNVSARSAPATATTLGAPAPPADSVAPTAPSWDSAVAVSATRIDLSWNASTDDVGVHGYHLYRDGNLVATVPIGSTVFSDVGLAPGTAFEYRLHALDGAGNVSAASAPLTAGTPSGP